MARLFYYQDSRGNFGDDLNPWIWYSLYPEIFNNTSKEYILGIGTLINDRAPRQGHIHVCGSGVGYHGPAQIDERWNFVFVRGPKSAEVLGLPQNAAITDPAILAAKLLPRRPSQTSMVSYMPHHDSLWRADWKALCEKVGLNYLDPSADIHSTIHQICRSKFVIAEAMHAAIVADALRIPWSPVRAYSHILDFKWLDWAQSLNIEYHPTSLPEIWDVEKFKSRKEVFKSRSKELLMHVGFSGRGWTPPIKRNTSTHVTQKLLAQLADLRDHAALHLSDDAVHRATLQRTVGVLDKFTSELKS